MTDVVVAAFAVENWKLQSALSRALAELPAEQRNRFEAQLRYSKGQLVQLLADSGMRLVVFDGEPFTAELPVSPINAEDVAGLDVTYVDRTLEPTIVADGSVVRMGKVLLRGV